MFSELQNKYMNRTTVHKCYILARLATVASTTNLVI